MVTLQKGFSARLLTFGLLLIVLVAGTFAAPMSVDHELAPPGAPSPRRGSTMNMKRSTHAEAQWVYMTIRNQASSGDMYIRNAHLNWGKWYENPDKGQELSDAHVQAKSAGPNGGSMGVAASGRAWTSSGTEGQFDIYHGNTKIRHAYWDCPWGHRHNSFLVSEVNDNYVVQDTGASLDSGALGSLTVKVVKTGETEETKCI